MLLHLLWTVTLPSVLALPAELVAKHMYWPESSAVMLSRIRVQEPSGSSMMMCSRKSLSHEFLMLTVRACSVYFLTESSRSCQISKERSSPSTVSFTSTLFSCGHRRQRR
ncbi:hypothetical protein EYF80_022195 [Liparis tanakae]|uniref:Secreted protein n=1 Tax=Liparis tanakae TaxID=230148 RepID=A0A4Z2HRT8_9TELE|nr:hypothetical protein EYF80_022195 [Liparis tanakae]